MILQNDMDGPMTFQLLGADKGMEWKVLNNGGYADTIIGEKFLINVSDEDYSVTSQMTANSQIGQALQNQSEMQALQMAAPQAWLAIHKAFWKTSKLPEDLKLEIVNSFPPIVMPNVLGANGGNPPSAPSPGPGSLLEPTAQERAGTLPN